MIEAYQWKHINERAAENAQQILWKVDALLVSHLDLILLTEGQM